MSGVLARRGDRMLDAQAVLQALNPESGPLDIKLGAAHANGLTDAQPVPVDHKEERVIADAVAPFLGGLEQPIDLRPGSESPSCARGSRWYPTYALHFAPWLPSLHTSKVDQPSRLA
jgi:hypothetical protein